MKRWLAGAAVGGVTVAGAAVAGPAAVAATLGNDVNDYPPRWRQVAECESGGNPQAVNPNSGAGGGLQFMPSTWDRYAPDSYPDSPVEASPQQEVVVAEEVVAAEGPDAWTCPGAPNASAEAEARTHSSVNTGDAKSDSSSRVYAKIDRGDTLSGIAESRGSTWVHLWSMAQPFLGDNPHQIEVGSKVNVTGHPKQE